MDTQPFRQFFMVAGQEEGLQLIFHCFVGQKRSLNAKYQPGWSSTMCKADAPALSNNTSYTVATLSSFDELNQRLDEKISLDNFRANIAISTDSREPFQEDLWDSKLRSQMNSCKAV